MEADSSKKSVYFLQSFDYVKIGYSRSPKRRIADLKVANPHIKTLVIIPAGKWDTLEGALHKRFKDLRLGNEWFSYDGDLRNLIEKLILYPEQSRSLFRDFGIILEDDGSVTLNRKAFPDFECPHCRKSIDNVLVRSHVAKQIGAIKSPRKGKRDPAELSRIGKLGGRPRKKKD